MSKISIGNFDLKIARMSSIFKHFPVYLNKHYFEFNIYVINIKDID